MTDGGTQLVGLIGWPVGHSLSPAMHNSAFAAYGLNWQYVPLPVRPGEVGAAVQGLGALGFRGANVTVPHKRAVLQWVTSVAPDARALGAANTLDISRTTECNTNIAGHNTDASGFLSALNENEFELASDASVVVVGAGGAARAVVFALCCKGVGEITVVNRTPERGETLIAELGGHANDTMRIRALPLNDETLVETSRVADLLVNATVVGMSPHTHLSVWPENVAIPSHLTVLDLVYSPLETRLLQQTRTSGAHPIDGLGMLVLQGAIAFEIWTGVGPVKEIASVMRNACE